LKPLRPKERRWLNRVRRMRAKGLTWDEIADKVGLLRNTAVSRHDRLEHRELVETLANSPVLPAIAKPSMHD